MNGNDARRKKSEGAGLHFDGGYLVVRKPMRAMLIHIEGGPFESEIDFKYKSDRAFEMGEFMDRVRREVMETALRQNDGVQKRAAETLGMNYPTFRNHAKRLGLFS